MTEADFQLLGTSLTAIVVAVTGSVTSYYGYRNHALGQANAAKIDKVQATAERTSNLSATQVMLTATPPSPRKATTMPTFSQDLTLLETVLADVEAFAAGQAATATVDGYSLSIQKIAGPTAPYTVLSGSVFSIILGVFALYEQLATGAPIQVAVKENNSWYGVTLTKAAVA